MTKLKTRQKCRQSTKIKRQANQGLEGILREGRGLRPIAFPYQKKRSALDKNILVIV